MESEIFAECMEMFQTMMTDIVTEELVSAVREGEEARVRTALARGGRPDVAVTTNDDMSECLVALAAEKGHNHLLLCLLEAGLSLEGKGTIDGTPLMLAASNGHLRTIEALLSLGADPLAMDSKGISALHIASWKGHQQCVAALTSITPHTHVHPRGITPVHVASYNGHKNVVEMLARAGWSLITADSDGNTPLHWAAEGGSVEMAEYLVQHDVDPQQKDRDGWTPLDVAVESGQHAVEEWLARNGGMKGATKDLVIAVEEGNEDDVRSALARGGRPDVTLLTNYNMSRCLVALAVSTDHSYLLPCLLEAGLSLEGGGTADGTPLMLAASNGHLRTTEALLSLGADPLATDSKGWTALHWAAQEGHQECTAALVPVTPHTHVYPLGITPVHVASYNGHKNVVQMLARAGWSLITTDSDGNTPLHWAAEGGSVEMAEYLVQQDVDPQQENHDGWTPLDMAVESGQHAVEEWLARNGGMKGATKELVSAVKEGEETRVRTALARGGRPDVAVTIKDDISGCLVGVAAEKGHGHLLPCLLEAGLSLEGGGTTDRTPLMCAASNGHLGTIETLLSLGADPLATESDGWTALHLAAQEDHQLCVAALVPVTSHTHVHPGGITPVHVASYNGHKNVVEMLARAGWSLITTDSEGNTPLHWAAEGGSVEMAEYLVQHDVDPQQKDYDGWTPLDVAVESGQHAVEEYLARNGGMKGATKELVSAVKEGDEPRLRTALTTGDCLYATVPNNDDASQGVMALDALRDHGQLLSCLMEAGLNLKGRRATDRTLLMCAAINGHLETIEAQLRFGADPLATDSKGWTALHWAAMGGHQQCVAALISVTPPTHVHTIGDTPVHVASFHGHKNVVEMLAGVGWSLTARNSDGETALHRAAQNGSVDVAEYLVQHDVDPRQGDNYRLTPLDVAKDYGNHEMEEWLTENGGGEVRNEADFLRLVRLWQDRDAARHSKIVSWMAADNKAAPAYTPEDNDDYLLDATGLTPIHVAANRGLPSHRIEVLLKSGVSPHVVTPDNMTPVDLARRGGHLRVLEALQQHHHCEDDSSSEKLYENLLIEICKGDDVQQVSRYLCKGVPVEPLGVHWLTALQVAVITNRIRTVRLLLASGASLSAGLLQESWQTCDVLPRVLAALTTAYCCRLRAERRRLEEVSPALVEGIDDLLKDIEGDTPWEAAWRKKSSYAHKSGLLTEAARANCAVTAAFLQKAGAWSFFSGAFGASALHAALESGHQDMANVLIRDLRGCPYVPDANSRLPRDLFSEVEQRKLDQRLFEEERERLEDLENRQKADHEKAAARKALDVQEVLFHDFMKGWGRNVPPADGRATLLLASRKGFLQLTYLLLNVGRVPVDEVLDNTCGTTALHQAASHGRDGCVALLLGAKADPLRRDTYGQTPRLLAAMFGHTSTCDLLAQHKLQDPPCRAGTTATQVTQNFDVYLQRYEKYDHKLLTPMDRHYPERVTKSLLGSISLRELQQKAQRVIVDFSSGEAREVREAVMAELNIIMKRVSAAHPTYQGALRLVGSSRDGSKLYAPDEYDVNIVIQKHDVRVEVSEREKMEASMKGRLQLSVDTDNPHLQGNKLMENLYEAVRRCIADHPLQDVRLSIVPPGLTSTQVGVGLSLAWQGQDYPLLLVGVDLVPVLEVPWHKQISRPLLTPKATTTMQLSNAADGSWRCSFAETEAEVLELLSPEERLPQVMGKVILSCLKAEPWMPRHKKSFCTWFAMRDWNIGVPSGFCFKNAFLWCLEKRMKKPQLQEEEQLQEVKQQQKEEFASREKVPIKKLLAGRKENPAKCLVDVFRHMCEDPEAPRKDLKSQSSSAYFGGDCEGPKAGEGAPFIVQHLEEDLEDSQGESDINTKGSKESEIDGERGSE